MASQNQQKPPTLEQHFKALEDMTDNKGILQHESNPIYDYSIDDQARALIVLSRFSDDFIRENLTLIYLDYTAQAKRFDKWFNNYKDAKGEWMKVREGITQIPDTLQDCYGRALWGLSEFLSSEYRTKLRESAEKLFFDSLENTEKLTYPHSLAFTIIGLSKLPKDKQNHEIKEIISKLSKKLVDSYKTYQNNYCVARIPQAFLSAGQALKKKKLKEIGKNYLDSIIEESFDENAVFHAKKNPNGDEQPIEAGVMAETCIDAYNITKKEEYLQSAINAMNWFFGQNSNKINMVAENSAVYDAITKDGKLNTNQGAESILTYLIAKADYDKLII